MKNLLTKVLFILLLSSVVMPSGIQANSVIEKLMTPTALEAHRGVLIGQVVVFIVNMLKGKNTNVDELIGAAAVGALTVAGIRSGIGAIAGAAGGELVGMVVEQLAGLVEEEKIGPLTSLACGLGIMMGAGIGAVERKKEADETIRHASWAAISCTI